MHDDVPLALLAVFVPFSLVSIGGGTSILAGIQHQAVDVHHWVTSREFVDLFAISRAAPARRANLVRRFGTRSIIANPNGNIDPVLRV